ncbi:uncharacterized protein LY79DRAFT_205208 [Colletotrichum navitas]|uniref:Uncharacterized protein n=1 Tax=Colletotrichum navitas TaxID=681940 RepID=A0AAD8QAD9_9PEZI|nr:uncharacterized protein LY79DRAFT_205208 [Colletotrichum navitas]KAK1599003.1 hypothetical protein LY79DRAFT_205208 [Colletotrichum navitas]
MVVSATIVTYWLKAPVVRVCLRCAPRYLGTCRWHPPPLHRSNSSHTHSYPMTSCTLRIRQRCHGPLQVYVNGLQCSKELVGLTLFLASITSRFSAAGSASAAIHCGCSACATNHIPIPTSFGGMARSHGTPSSNKSFAWICPMARYAYHLHPP